MINELSELFAEKVKKARFQTKPYKHLLVKDFLPEDVLKDVLSVLDVGPSKSLSALENKLKDDWKVQPFPGCAKSWRHYRFLQTFGLPWNDPRVDGRGLALRYHGPADVIENVCSALKAEPFTNAIKEKLGIDYPTSVDSGLQKYLDGYEISPHTDPHGKAATILLNLGVNGEAQDGMGTRLLTLKENRKYISEYWRTNTDVDPDWLPWDWCETEHKADDTNALLVFAPDEHTIHAVKIHNDHLKAQRAQIYGDMWDLRGKGVPHRASYKALDIQPDPSLRTKVSVYRQTKRLAKMAKESELQ